jgi:hypothetical protein
VVDVQDSPGFKEAPDAAQRLAAAILSVAVPEA